MYIYLQYLRIYCIQIFPRIRIGNAWGETVRYFLIIEICVQVFHLLEVTMELLTFSWTVLLDSKSTELLLDREREGGVGGVSCHFIILHNVMQCDYARGTSFMRWLLLLLSRGGFPVLLLKVYAAYIFDYVCVTPLVLVVLQLIIDTTVPSLHAEKFFSKSC